MLLNGGHVTLFADMLKTLTGTLEVLPVFQSLDLQSHLGRAQS